MLLMKQECRECRKDYKDFLKSGQTYIVKSINNEYCVAMSSKGIPIKVAKEYFVEDNETKEEIVNIATPAEEAQIIEAFHSMISSETERKLFTPIVEKKRRVLEYIKNRKAKEVK